MTGTHQRVAELMPWFVNETLTDTERELVERHIRECLPCRRAAAEERALRDAVREQDVPAPVERGLDSLLATIDGQEQHANRSSARTTFRPALTPGWAAFTAAACAVLVVAALQLPYFTDRQARPDAADSAFRTLADEAPFAATTIDVVFVTPPDPDALQRFAEEIGATAVAGPSELGRYSFTLAEDAELDTVLDRLNADPRVRIAARTFIDEADPQ